MTSRPVFQGVNTDDAVLRLLIKLFRLADSEERTLLSSYCINWLIFCWEVVVYTLSTEILLKSHHSPPRLKRTVGISWLEASTAEEICTEVEL